MLERVGDPARRPPDREQARCGAGLQAQRGGQRDQAQVDRRARAVAPLYRSRQLAANVDAFSS